MFLYTPQQNVVSKRRKCTLKEMANCMIQSTGLRIYYWVKSINYENYIVNNTPTKNLKNITLKEAWHKINPNVRHFLVFGSVAWAHILDEKRKELWPKREKCIFVGYCEDLKGCVLIQSHSNETKVRRYLKFDEIVLAYEPDLGFVPSFVYNPYLTFVPYSIPILVSSLDNENEDENHFFILTFLQMIPLNMNPKHCHCFLDGFVQHEKHLVILLVILQINIRHICSSRNPPHFWIKFQRLNIQTHLHNLLSI
jgi:hypothetical protein